LTHHIYFVLVLNPIIPNHQVIIHQLHVSKHKLLMTDWNAFLVADFGFDVVDGVGCFHAQRDGLASERLHEDLHTGDLQQGGSTQRIGQSSSVLVGG
jgi:hypothetical protein